MSQGTGTADPFAPRFSKLVAQQIKSFLTGPEVQRIHFAFGSIEVAPVHFQELARRFDDNPYHSGLSGIRVVINPVYLAQEKSLAQYNADADAFYFRTDLIMTKEVGRGVVLHECVHAVCDLRARSTAIRSEEGAAELARAWYHVIRGTRAVAPDIPQSIWQVADAVAARGAAGRVVLRGSEINAMRLEMARQGYENEHYSNDGVSRPTT
jgi:hypothetical protein